MTSARAARLAAALLAALLAPGCLNFFVPEGGAGTEHQYTIEVRARETEPGDAYRMNRTDLEDLLVDGKDTTDLNSLVYLLDEASAGVRPQSFVHVSEAAWTAGLSRFDALCRARTEVCSGGPTYTVVWKATPVEVTFVRTLV